ncbi:hypothetical protein [Chitinophaga sp. CB10]|uniref:hypothetical protein n=1 Tax=Chitinophaga sp. CB10 TaxID=1891659 RepID=UPI0025BB6042|nr:hypothetical protein [Chitinophaga sp. CB10]
MEKLSKTTTDHDTIRQWAEARNGKPTQVQGTGEKGEAGVLRIDFPPGNDNLEEISWEKFFEKFDNENLVFLYQDETSEGETSYFNKLIYEEDSDKK